MSSQQRKSRKRKARTIDDEVDKGRLRGTQRWHIEKIMDYHLSQGCFDPSRGKRMVYFSVAWEGYGADEHTIEPVTNLLSCKNKVLKFLKEKGLELKMDRATEEAWLVERVPLLPVDPGFPTADLANPVEHDVP
ncbi:hypothetical protein RvY_05418 [Ramazzottius varieornatus]|uniref:Chromo domain-containing protein n=1 Tax=Ramazzottius varieornatus TaxID=947166 RepID=A0A1D1V3X9_RAMVA|nr:hypothetical protein RvY_05418 [Ramazzottius varieornatus]